MPADRLITITTETPGHRNDQGVYIPGQSVARRVWATRMDRSLEDVAEEGGQRDETRRDWRIRWRSDVAALAPSDMKVTDEGQDFDVQNMIEVTDEGRTRRRFLDVQGVYTT